MKGKTMKKTKNTVCFDVETTGLDPQQNEILQLSAIDENGNELLNEFIKPTRATSGPKAESIHGISPARVANCPTFSDIKNKVQKIFSQANLLVGYNLTFDIKFLQCAGIKIPDVEIVDVMQDFAPIGGDWSEYGGNYKGTTLANCAKYYDYEFKAHDSLEDVKATLHCYYAMQNKENLAH